MFWNKYLNKIYMKDLIVGNGEVGNALYSLLSKEYEVDIIDFEEKTNCTNINVMHICFPYDKNFVKEVKKYTKLYKPKYTVIHSTVKIGTSKKCKAYYSPVRGIHPHLEQSLKTFVKYLAPKNDYLVEYFKKCGIEIQDSDSSETLETMKLYCTTIYGLNIIAQKEMWNFCKKHGLDFDIAYTESNQSYNDGYDALGYSKYKKYVLKHYDGKIGGHCVIPNCELLNTDIAKFVLKQNNKL